MLNGTVTRIFVAPQAGEPMQELTEVLAVAGAGLEGDRYSKGQGFFSKIFRVPRHVSLIAEEAIEAANFGLINPFSPEETRRNIVTIDVDLNALVGVVFWIGEVKLRGTELCTPCRRPSDLASKPGFKETFQGRGGLRAEVLIGGFIQPGDQIRVED